MTSEAEYVAMVMEVKADGPHGPYLIAHSEEFGSVTFSLKDWKRSEWPDSGTILVVSSLIKKPAGWRARKARFWTPKEEENPGLKAQASKLMEARRRRIAARKTRGKTNNSN